MKVFQRSIIPTNGSQDSYKTICAFLENYCEKNNFFRILEKTSFKFFKYIMK